ncbi:MAG: formyltransferase family protein [Planctomycetota bacterium]|jgi:methionyl-tRNA formyltransferase
MTSKIAVLTSKSSWFLPYAKKFVELLNSKNYEAKLLFEHEKIGKSFEIVFILCYFRIIERAYLAKHKHNLVVHESDLPKGRGWAPLFWQILEGKNEIPVVLFEASESADDGDIYIKDYINFKGTELHDEIREKQAVKTTELCLRFLEEIAYLAPTKQKVAPTFYKRRTPKDSKVDINRSIKEQFNLLRTVNNEDFPAYFHHKGSRYILKIFQEGYDHDDDGNDK